MIDAWKKAWNDAVENFWRELRTEPGHPGDAAGRAAAMRRDLAAAAEELDRLEAEVARAHRQLAAERDEEERCRRREAMAREIGDPETARIAAGFAARHAERAAILAQKVHALDAERELRRRDLQEMETALRTAAPQAGTVPPPAAASDPLDEDDAEFRRLDRDARERAAAERLEELKRRMR